MSPNGAGSNATARLFEPDIAMRDQIGQSSGSGGRYMSLDTYAGWFDIDTNTVLERCWRTMYPKDDYLTVTLNNAPDLYGPFWVPTTLIFALFLSSSLSSSIQAYLAGHTYSYDFTKLSVAVSVVYIYSLAIPFGLWAVMRYWAGVDERGPVDIVSIYGCAHRSVLRRTIDLIFAPAIRLQSGLQRHCLRYRQLRWLDLHSP